MLPRDVSLPNSDSSTSRAALMNGLTNSTFTIGSFQTYECSQVALFDALQRLEKLLDLLRGRAEGVCRRHVPFGLGTRPAATDRTRDVRGRVGQTDHACQRRARRRVGL